MRDCLADQWERKSACGLCLAKLPSSREVRTPGIINIRENDAFVSFPSQLGSSFLAELGDNPGINTGILAFATPVWISYVLCLIYQIFCKGFFGGSAKGDEMDA